MRRLIEDLLREQLSLTSAVMAFAGAEQAGADAAAAKASVQSWSAIHRDQVKIARDTIDEIEASAGGWSFAKLTIVNAAVGALIEAAK